MQARADSSRAALTLTLCALAALLEGFDNQSMGVAAPRLVAEFGLSKSAAGIIFSATPIGLFIGAAVGGRLADHLGRKSALVGSLLLFGLFSIFTALAAGPQTLFAARLLTGLGLGGAMPNFISLSSEATRERHRVSVVTVIMAAMPFGGAIAALVSLGGQSAGNWRSIFYIGGCAPVIVALVIHYLLPSATRHASASSMIRVPIEGVAQVLFGSGRAATTLLLWVGFFFTQLVLLLMLNWLPSLLIGLGFSSAQASWGSVCFNLGGSLGSWFLGRLHAGVNRRRWVFTTYTCIALALVGVASIGKGFPIAAVACALAGVFIIGAQLILFALAPLYYATPIRGTGVGASVAIGRLGSVFGPLFAGALLAGGGGSAAVLLGIVPFVIIAGGAAFALTWREQSHDQ